MDWDSLGPQAVQWLLPLFLDLRQWVHEHTHRNTSTLPETPGPSLDLVWGRHPGHPTLPCLSAACDAYWGSKPSLMRARRLLSESTFTTSLPSSGSWVTSRDVVSESSRKLKSLHSTGKTEMPRTWPHGVGRKTERVPAGARWRGHTYHSGSEPMTPRGAGYNQPPRRQDVKDSVQIPTNKKLILSVCPMHSGVKQHSKVGVWSRQRFSAGPCKGMSGSCPKNPELPES